MAVEFFAVAALAQGLEIVLLRAAALTQWNDVIDLEQTGTATAPAAPAVAHNHPGADRAGDIAGAFPVDRWRVSRQVLDQTQPAEFIELNRAVRSDPGR